MSLRAAMHRFYSTLACGRVHVCCCNNIRIESADSFSDRIRRQER
ncbi:hypothetical protein HMPREF0762_01608 [Slackia exigua ATCC 700122]|uniref:Uncharacterized protein n=1 Tax=Slackia exigua (strain ATCC 700122 / DSM 15923 / CIP 105133 / JCM 11022 / KCTC 5966 / S-7) TaxID=649764 RepID=D0WID3_SLAES|nr:hypothetical protein HMPREF0762_01608 [Slackia exigua ATCC 700122]